MKLVIIGAGPGGYAAAIRAASRGAEVVLIDKEQPGGVCLNMGCIPSKVMRRAADFVLYAALAKDFGIEGGTPVVDFKALRARQREVVDDLVQGLLEHFREKQIKFVQGRARVQEPGLVSVQATDGRSSLYSYDHLLLALGSVPAELAGLETDGNKIINSDQALWMEDKPESLLIVGAGVIGCELARIFHDLGVKVCLVELGPRLLPLPSIDAEISKTLMRAFKKARLQYYTGRVVESVAPCHDGLDVVIKAGDGGSEGQELLVEKILVATGRMPLAADIGLKELGITFDEKGWIKVSREFRTSAPDVWAIGDCLGPGHPMLAHSATAAGFAAVDNMFGASSTVENNTVPAAVFTSPEIGVVGLTLAQAEQQFPGSRASDFLFRQLGKAQAIGEIDGLARLVSAPDGRLLGAHIIGPSACTIIAEAALAVSNNLQVADLARTIHAHPTLSEVLWEDALLACGHPLHGG